MTRRLGKRDAADLERRSQEKLETMAVEETYFLQALKQAGELRIQDVGKLGSGMLDVCDRLVASGEVTRYPGTIFGVSPAGDRRLSGDPVA